MPYNSVPRYSATYEDDMYQYRHIIVDKSMLSIIPKNRLMDECEWRALGIQQGDHWEHYLIHKPEPFVLMFRRPLKYKTFIDKSINEQQQNTLFPDERKPGSGLKPKSTFGQPLADSTNFQKSTQLRTGFHLTMNTSKFIH